RLVRLQRGGHRSRERRTAHRGGRADVGPLPKRPHPGVHRISERAGHQPISGSHGRGRRSRRRVRAERGGFFLANEGQHREGFQKGAARDQPEKMSRLHARFPFLRVKNQSAPPARSSPATTATAPPLPWAFGAGAGEGGVAAIGGVTWIGGTCGTSSAMAFFRNPTCIAVAAANV